MAERHEVCRVEDLPPGERTIVEANGVSIGVFNVDGEYHALANVCPHQLGPLCEGQITGEMASGSVGEYELRRDGEVIQCPWHGWKFNIEDGTSVFNPHELRTRTYEVTVERPTAETVNEQEVEMVDKEEVEMVDEGEAEYGTTLEGEEPPVDTYPVEVESDVVVLYV